MKPLILFSAKELGDPILASLINARFNAFMAKFCANNGQEFCTCMSEARDMLREAEIPQLGDELINEGPAVLVEDITPFMEA